MIFSLFHGAHTHTHIYFDPPSLIPLNRIRSTGNNNIKGTIPSELALLTNLKVLLLEGNPRLDNSVPTVLQTFLTANNVVHDLTW